MKPFSSSVPYPRRFVLLPTPNKPPRPAATTNRTVEDSSLSEPSPVRGGCGRSDSEIVASGWLMLALCAASALIGMAMLAAVAMGWN